VFICDFHREQSWTRWVSKTDNGVSGEKESVLGMLRRCAHATSQDMFEAAVFDLQNSPVWKKNVRLRNWFTRTWLAEKKVFIFFLEIDSKYWLSEVYIFVNIIYIYLSICLQS
jgi:hypothetical protein